MVLWHDTTNSLTIAPFCPTRSRGVITYVVSSKVHRPALHGKTTNS